MIEILNRRLIVTKSCIDVITNIGNRRIFECSLLMKYDSLFRINLTYISFDFSREFIAASMAPLSRPDLLITYLVIESLSGLL